MGVRLETVHDPATTLCAIAFLSNVRVTVPAAGVLVADVFETGIFSTDIHTIKRGPGSSVGIATDYGLDGPGSNPGGDEIFRPSRSALGLTQPPVPGLSRG